MDLLEGELELIGGITDLDLTDYLDFL